MEDETVATDIRSRYENFARVEADPRSPLYADWARGVASDDEVIGRIETLPPVKQQANLVFASARFAGVPLPRGPRSGTPSSKPGMPSPTALWNEAHRRMRLAVSRLCCRCSDASGSRWR